jgi:hypothetical protein
VTLQQLLMRYAHSDSYIYLVAVFDLAPGPWPLTLWRLTAAFCQDYTLSSP